MVVEKIILDVFNELLKHLKNCVSIINDIVVKYAEARKQYIMFVKDYLEKNLSIKIELDQRVLDRVVLLGFRCPCRPVLSCPCPFLVHDLLTIKRCYCGLFRVIGSEEK